jgi:hypothetical protein
MARWNGRQDIGCDDGDRILENLGRAAVRCSWRNCASVVMSNHLHVVLRTLEPNLFRGMQGFLSAYSHGWFAPASFFVGLSSRADILSRWSKMRATASPPDDALDGWMKS